jgi:hypothetical protein
MRAPRLKSRVRFARSLKPPGIRAVADDSTPVARDRFTPATVVWLAAIGALGIRWGSPLSHFYSNAILADSLIALAALLFAADLMRGRIRLHPRGWHLWLAAYVAWIGLAALAAPDRDAAAKDFLLIAELAVLAVMTAALAEPRAAARALARVVLAATFFTFILAALALALFYAGHRTGLLSGYGDLAPSSSYARVRAGFASAPLLASWCIAASAILAWPRGELPRTWRIAGQLALAFLVVATLARGVLAFALAFVFRWAAARPGRGPKLAAAGAAAAVVAVLAALTAGNLRTKPLGYDFPYPGPRRVAVTTSWQTLRGDPLFGIGPGRDPGVYGGMRFRAHLTPLNVAATAGLPALLALVGLAVALWRGRSRPTDIAIWSGLAALMIDGLAQDVDHFRHVWVVIGLAAVAPRGVGGVPSDR